MSKTATENYQTLKTRCKQLTELVPTEEPAYNIKLFTRPNITQIIFQSIGCQWQKTGSCLMCNYGKSSTNITPNQVVTGFRIARESGLFENRKILILNTFGSILDPREMPADSFATICEQAKQTPVPLIIFETRPETITQNKIHLIKSHLGPDKRIGFELGIEVFDETLRKNLLIKDLKQSTIISKIHLLHDANCHIIANILVGLPFIDSIEQRIATTVQTTINLDQHLKQTDQIFLFPINPKPHTYLHELYQTNRYQLTSHREIVAVMEGLSTIPNLLDKLYLTYYGRRNAYHSPSACEKCQQEQFYPNFYEKFMSIPSNRQQFFQDFISQLNTRNCPCSHL